MKKTYYVAIVLVAIGIFSYALLGGSDLNRPISIGLISSETGDFAAVGASFAEGVRFAYEKYGAQNPDTEVVLHAEDDGTDSKKGLSAYGKLTSLNKIDGLINFSSPTINVVYGSVARSGIPLIQLGEQAVDPAADSVYQIYPTQDAPEVATGEYVAGLDDGAETVLFFTNDSTVMKFVGNIKKGFGKEFAGEFELDQNQKEYRTIVAKAMALNPKYAVISAFTQNGVRVVQELLKYENRPVIVFDLTFDTIEYGSFFSDLGVLDGSYAMGLAQNLDPDFARLFKERYGKEPNVFTGYGYDAFNVLLSNHDEDRDAWVNNIGVTSLRGVTGEISFNGLGLRAPRFEMRKIQGGELVKIQE